MSAGEDSPEDQQGALFDQELAVKLEGRVARVLFHAEDTGFSVLLVEADPRPDGVTGPIRVVGHVAEASAGEHVSVDGRWVEDKRFGRQIKASTIRRGPPASVDAIESYLGSGVLHGVGPAMAEALLHRFGAKVFDIIEKSPERLQEVHGIGPAKADKIAESWAEHRQQADAMMFLHEAGVGQALAGRIQKTYGERAVAVVQADPYRLARDVKGVGFRTADAIARSLDVDQTSPGRIEAGLLHVLQEAAAQDGHCALPRDQLLGRAAALLEVERALLEERLESLARTLEVVIEQEGDAALVFEHELHRAEATVADRLAAIAARPPPWPMIDAARMIDGAEETTGVTLSEDQRAAVRQALTAKIAIVTGGPGVGKTTILKLILAALDAIDLDVALCAPTGRAAKRLQESAERAASTIHRLLGVRPGVDGFAKNDGDPLKCDLLVVDEMSMVDARLFEALLEATPDDAALLLVGDADQLPSVGPGQVLADLIESGVVKTARLERVHRQAEASRIVEAAHRINHGQLPELGARDGDFFFAAGESPERALDIVLELVRKRIPDRFGLAPPSDIQVLTPMNKGLLGADSLNAVLQKALNPNVTQSLDYRGQSFRLGDKVMQRVNDYEKDVYNGDVGLIDAVDRDERTLKVRFDDRRIDYAKDDLDALQLAYACTIHKAQGSEYPAVIVVLHKQHHAMLRRDLLYTAVTRGKSLVVVTGARSALERAAQENPAGRRITRLARRLRARFEEKECLDEAEVDWDG